MAIVQGNGQPWALGVTRRAQVMEGPPATRKPTPAIRERRVLKPKMGKMLRQKAKRTKIMRKPPSLKRKTGLEGVTSTFLAKRPTAPVNPMQRQWADPFPIRKAGWSPEGEWAWKEKYGDLPMTGGFLRSSAKGAAAIPKTAQEASGMFGLRRRQAAFRKQQGLPTKGLGMGAQMSQIWRAAGYNV